MGHPRAAYALILAIHIIAMMSWVGAMYFNLVLVFPMYRSRGLREYGDLMMAQGARAVWLLYGLVALTLASGLGLSWMSGRGTGGNAPMWIGTKVALWAVMLTSHLVGTLRIWPKVFLSLPSELERLFLRYRVWMALSATAGTVAIVASVFRRIGAH